MTKNFRIKVGVRSTHQVQPLDHMRWGLCRKGSRLVKDEHQAVTPMDVFLRQLVRGRGRNV